MGKQIHGGDIYRNQNVMDFSVNSNPLGPPEAVIRAIREQAEAIVHYPDMECEGLKNAIGKYENIEPSKILCGNGAAELFFAIVQALRPKKALLFAPTFSEYENALRTVDAKIDYYILKNENNFLVEQNVLERISSDLDILFLCNPNNPTGLMTEPELLEKIIRKCEEENVYLVLDECFLDFLEDADLYEMKHLCSQCSKLIIVKAFTKIFCMPGLRLGYCICGDENILASMRKMLQPWNVSVLAQICGVAAMKDCKKYIKETKTFLKEEKDYLIDGMKCAGYMVYPSRANYLFFEGPEGLYEKALEDGYLIRDCQNYRGLSEGYYRIAVRTHEENERMITWLRKS